MKKTTTLQNEVILDIKEDDINKLNEKLLATLLTDRTTKKNIIWGTGDYTDLGQDYAAGDEIKAGLITGKNAGVIPLRFSAIRMI